MRRALLTVVLALATAHAAPAHADDGRDYGALLSEGIAMYNEGDYTGARESLIAAYELRPNPKLLFFIAKSYQRDGDFRSAQIYYDQFLAEAPESDSLRAEAERYAAMVDVHLIRRDARFERVRPLQPEALAPAPDPRAGARTWFWRSVASTAVLFGATTYAASRVRGYEDDKLDALVRLAADEPGLVGAEQGCAFSGRDTAAARDLADACAGGQRWATATNVLALGALGTAVASGYFYYKGWLSDAPERQRVRVAPSVSPDGAGVSLGLSF